MMSDDRTRVAVRLLPTRSALALTEVSAALPSRGQAFHAASTDRGQQGPAPLGDPPVASVASFRVRVKTAELRRRMLALGLSGVELARRAKVAEGTISHALRGRPIQPATLRAIAAALARLAVALSAKLKAAFRYLPPIRPQLYSTLLNRTR
jgi:hypothetical protein